MCSCSTLAAAAGRRRPCQSFTSVGRRRTRGSATLLTPPTVDEIIAIMRVARGAPYGNRLNGLIVVLWRAGLRINKALSLTETDLEQRRGSILVRHGKGDRRRLAGMDAWGWAALESWVAERETLPIGPLFCVVAGPTRGHAWSASAARLELHRTAVAAGVRRRVATRGDRAAADPAPAGALAPLHDRHLPARHLLRRDHLDRPRRRAPMMHASAGLEL
jgi:site-specific recombinase XerC